MTRISDGTQRQLASLAIISCLALQLAAAVGFQPGWSQTRRNRLWPFLNYPMYQHAHHPGDLINQYALMGTLDDASIVRIKPEDLGLDYWKFLYGPIAALRTNDVETLPLYVRMYQRRHHRCLVQLRLENYPWLLAKDGVHPAPVEVVREVRVADVEPRP